MSKTDDSKLTGSKNDEYDNGIDNVTKKNESFDFFDEDFEQNFAKREDSVDKKLRTDNSDDHNNKKEIEENIEEDSLQIKKDLSNKIQELEKSLEEKSDELLRMYAEMSNLRTRTDNEIVNAKKFGLTDFIKNLLPILDSLEKIIESPNLSQEGVELTLKMFKDLLKKYKVAEINPLNQLFNPEFHEAVSIRKDEKLEHNTILDVLRKGYMLGSRLLRPALVEVSEK